MRAIERRVQVTGRSDWIVVYGLFDLHLGARACREDLLCDVIENIRRNRNAYWLGGGDYAEFINRSDPRHRESDLAPWLYGKDDLAKEQTSRLIAMLAPIASQCIGILCGNHEDVILRHYERNVYASVLDAIKDAGHLGGQIGVGFGGFITLRVARGAHISTLTIFAEHGFGGGRLKGGDVLNSQRIFAYYDTDVYLTGHRHKAHLIPHTRIGVWDGKVKERVCLAGMCGAFRARTAEQEEDNPGGYEDVKAYPPGDLAGVRIWFKPDEHELRGEVYSYTGVGKNHAY